MLQLMRCFSSHFSFLLYSSLKTKYIPEILNLLCQNICIYVYVYILVQVRNWIMPINRKYNLGLLLETLREELHSRRNYKVLFEYVMLAGINDR